MLQGIDLRQISLAVPAWHVVMEVKTRAEFNCTHRLQRLRNNIDNGKEFILSSTFPISHFDSFIKVRNLRYFYLVVHSHDLSNAKSNTIETTLLSLLNIPSIHLCLPFAIQFPIVFQALAYCVCRNCSHRMCIITLDDFCNIISFRLKFCACSRLHVENSMVAQVTTRTRDSLHSKRFHF